MGYEPPTDTTRSPIAASENLACCNLVQVLALQQAVSCAFLQRNLKLAATQFSHAEEVGTSVAPGSDSFGDQRASAHERWLEVSSRSWTSRIVDPEQRGEAPEISVGFLGRDGCRWIQG